MILVNNAKTTSVDDIKIILAFLSAIFCNLDFFIKSKTFDGFDGINLFWFFK